jgi:hypothetical protein
LISRDTGGMVKESTSGNPMGKGFCEDRATVS